MKDQIDKKIVEHIKVVLGQWEEPYNPDDWERLLKKRRRNRRIILWLPLRYAAVLMLLLTTSLSVYFFMDNREVNNNRVDKLLQKEKYVEKNQMDDKNDASKDPGKTVTKESNSTIIVEETMHWFSDSRRNNATAEIHKDFSGINDKEYLFDELTESNLADSVISGTMSNIEKMTKELMNQELAGVEADKQVFDELLNEEIDEKIVDELLRRSVSFGLVVSPMINYSQRTDQSTITFSGGAFVEVPIFKNIDFNTGLSLINQQIRFEENQLNEIDEGNQLKSREAILTGLELPLNIKYNFKIRNKKWFASIGISSTTYFREEIKSTYQETRNVTVQGINGIEITQKQNRDRIEREDIRSESESMNFAGILNASFGFEIPLNNDRQSAIIEPFIYSSLSPVTKENIRFTNIGVRLKLNLND